MQCGMWASHSSREEAWNEPKKREITIFKHLAFTPRHKHQRWSFRIHPLSFSLYPGYCLHSFQGAVGTFSSVSFFFLSLFFIEMIWLGISTLRGVWLCR
ncbi:hypothetical protein EYC84_007693 [Monilinia fructicola]|uniref:Uncharacterized protein n=1 Tax=Monilinia fructicola TaxID=38448 RepID=A0A5M9JLK7_MONFR|nr:hypothetical protein EYC84_007693 [Monilinia fructicola]